MMTLIRLELLRVARDLRFWFWSLVGVPFLIPSAIVIIAFAAASFGTVEPEETRPVLATTSDDKIIQDALGSAGITFDTLPLRDDVVAALTAGNYSVGLVDVSAEPGQPLEATLLSLSENRGLPLYLEVEALLEQVAINRRTELIDSLHFDGPSFELLVEPVVISEELAPDRLRSGLLQTVVLMWSTLLVFPYLLLSWNGGSRVVTDRESGYLSTLNSGSLPPWRWLVVRWASLSVVAGALLLFSAALFLIYMRAYAAVADMLVAEGILEGLSDGAARKAQAYLVDSVSMWRETSIVAFFLWLFLAILQLAAAAAVLLWGSVKASSLAQYRFFELLPFAVIFLLPLIGLGALGHGLGLHSWMPGLNTVLTLEHVVTGQLPGRMFFATGAASVLANTLLILAFLGLGTWALRNERLWSV